MNRSLQELQARAKAALAEFAPEIRSECIALARRKSPSSVTKHANQIADRHGMSRRAIQLVKMTRWLAIILRDYGNEMFEATANDISHLYTAMSGGWIIMPPKAESHLRAHPEVSVLLAEAIGKIHLPSTGDLAYEVDMNRFVGRTGRVAASDIGLDGRGTFALRIGRHKPSRIALDIVAPEVQTVVVRAMRNLNVSGEFILITAYVGSLAPREPWDAKPGSERDTSLRFWTTQALVYDPAVMGEPFESSWREILES